MQVPALSMAPAEKTARTYNSNIIIRRWAATWVDLIALAVLATLPAIVVEISLGAQAVRQSSFDSFMVVWAIAAVLLYYIALEGRFGWTLGKLALGIRVVNGDGDPPGFVSALLRTLARLVEVNPILLGGLPAGIVVGLSAKRQRLGDMLAGTYVLRVADARALHAGPPETGS